MTDRYLTAREAAALLKVSLPTLYAYVSRGMLRSEPVGGNPRGKRYFQADVARLLERKELRRDPATAAARTLHWGTPVLDSSLTLIDEGRIYYRGQDAVTLANKATVEHVAALLWLNDAARADGLFANADHLRTQSDKALRLKAAGIGPVERCQLVLARGVTGDPGAYDLRPAAVARTGARILRLMVSAVCDQLTSGPIDESLQRAWLPRRSAAASALRAALILCADHELNVSAFTARCIASARATPYEVVIGALAALKGKRHGGYTEEVESLFREAGRGRDPREVLANRLRLGEGLPGFGHPLYPKGDPRAATLLSLAKRVGRGSALNLADSLAEAAQSLTGEHPTVDFALVVLSRALDLPAHSPIALFSLGRTIGWIAHAIEQYADARLIRPRARYVGVLPD
ncbi:MAG TPA: citrate synthase family protein [Blastocatellia bacterium]|nr:citrate synthase family protein [Blastocatellia bacterium]